MSGREDQQEVRSDESSRAALGRSEAPAGNSTRPAARAALWIAAAVVPVVIAGIWLGWSRGSVPPGPAIRLAGMPAAVAEALENAERQVRRSPRSADAWGHWAMVLMAHDLPEQAVACLQEAERLDPAAFRWPYYRGMCLIFTDPSGAQLAFQRAVDLEGDVAVLRWELAERLLAANRLDAAETHLRHAHSLDPGEPRGLLARGRLAFLRGDLKESRNWTERAVAAAPDARGARELLSQILYRMDETAAAAEQARICRRLGTERTAWYDPLMADVVALCRAPSQLLIHGTDLCSHGRFSEAESVLRSLVSLEPDGSEAHALLGYALLQQGRRTEAKAALDRALELAPRSAEAHYYQGLHWSLASEWGRAVDSFRKAVESKPDYAAAHYNLGQCLRELGDTANAASAFRDALRAQPDLAAAHAALGELLLFEGRNEEAIAHLETAVRLSPSDRHFRQLLRSSAE